jgi:TonB family protein
LYWIELHRLRHLAFTAKGWFVALGEQARSFIFGLFLLGFLNPPNLPAQTTEQQVSARKVKKRVEPTYPALAKQYRLAGRVRIEVTVSTDGSVLRTRLVGGSPLLAGAALDAVKQWKYETGTKDTLETIDFDFRAE